MEGGDRTEAGHSPPDGDSERSYRVYPSDPEAARELGRSCGVSATTGQVLLNRGLDDEASARSFLDPRLSELSAPEGMADRQVAAQRLARAVRVGERIAVFGDYDVDGTTSAALMADVLEALGADVVALVANRLEGGYGFSAEALSRCRETRARVIVTCDCGSSDHERIEECLRAGIDVVVVDHHLVPEQSLPAYAFINPQRPACGFPYKGLASAGLVLSLGAAVRAELQAELDLRAWLDLVALGTVADVVPLDGDNRRLVRAGLRRLSAAEGRPGMQALRELARLRPGAPVGATDVAFRLAPRLNAAGRIGDPTLTLQLLRSRSVEDARAVAGRIEQLNEERKVLTERVTEEALEQAREVYGAQPRSGVVVASDDWHPGVVGIAAARLVEQLEVPVVCIALQGNSGRGSVRAPDGARVYDALQRCSSVVDGLGGHQAAAGLTLARPRLDRFRAAFADATSDPSIRGASPAAWVDVELDGATFGLPGVQELLRLEPLGQGNAEPRFALKDARIEECRVVGQEHLKLSLRLGATALPAFARRMAHRKGTLRERVTAIGSLRPDAYRGGTTAELAVDDFQD